MKISGGPVRLLVSAAFGISLLMSVGCTKYASPDDLKKLDEANKAAVSAEADLDHAKADRMALEKKVAAKQADLDAAKAEFEKVKTR